MSRPRERTITLDAGAAVSGLLYHPAEAQVLFVVAHGAGAGMRHAFLTSLAEDLAAAGVATLRYQFPYMERGGRRPDPPERAQRAVRAAVEHARRVAPGACLIAGGKSFGGRMTSQAAVGGGLPGVSGLVFLGFPLHAPGVPGTARAAHLEEVRLPMLFLQGTRDALADIGLMRSVCEGLGSRATLEVVDDGDHSFAVPKRARRSEQDVREQLVAAIVRWSAPLAAGA